MKLNLHKIKIFNSLTVRIISVFSIIMLFIFSTFTFFFIKYNTNQLIDNKKLEIEKTTSEMALQINTFIEAKINISTTIASSFENFQDIEEKNRRTVYDNILKNCLTKNNALLAVWVKFKPYTIDNNDTLYENTIHGISGQYIKCFYRDKEKIVEKPRTLQDEMEFTNFIDNKKQNSRAYIYAPKTNNYSNSLTDTTFIISIISPIYYNNEFIGITGIDIELQELMNLFATEQQLYDIYILSDEKKFIFHANKKFQNKLLTNIYPTLSENYQLIKKIEAGESFTNSGKIFHSITENYYFFNSIFIKDANKFWNIIISVPSSEINRKKSEWIISIIITAIILYLFLLFIPFLLSNFLKAFLKKISLFLKKLSTGEFYSNEKKNISFAIKDLQNISEEQETLQKNLQKTAKFATTLSKSNIDADFKAHSENDILGKSLIKLQNNIIKNKQRDEERLEKQKNINWFNAGIAKFSEILRKNQNDIESLTYMTISQLTEYIDAIQGGFFVTNFDNENNTNYLSLSAFYSYNRKIYLKKRIDYGDGLVGTCAIEQKIIHTQIPDNYLEISSGLGKAKPQCAILCPLLFNNELYGVIEIASINQIKDYQIKFVENISGTIASAIASYKINRKTVELLKESNKHSDKMIKKETELKEKIREFEIIQAEASKAEKQMNGIINSLNEIGYTAEFDIKMKAISVNNKLLKILKTTYSEATSKNYFDFFSIDIDDLEQHNKYWETVKKGNNVAFFLKTMVAGNEIWFNVILSPIFDENNQVIKTLFIAFDYTSTQKQNEKVTKLIDETQDKIEQLNIQEQEMEFTYNELEDMYKQNDIYKKQVQELEINSNKFENTTNFFKKELEKRIKRFRKVEQKLKQKNNDLQEKIETYNELMKE